MNYAPCCAELEKLIVSPEKQKGLGLMIVVHKWGPTFLLMYSRDWTLPEAEAGVQIKFCPFCGTKLAF
jgi:hypothetical protein